MIIDCKCKKEKDTFVIEFDEVQIFNAGESMQIEHIFEDEYAVIVKRNEE